MSSYYKIKISGETLKVRVSDHEPNERLNGSSDIEFYTKTVCNQSLCVYSQVEAYCEKNDLNIELFAAVIKDYPQPEINYYEGPKKIKVSADFVSEYHKINGKRSMRRKENYCKAHKVCDYKMSQGLYEII